MPKEKKHKKRIEFHYCKSCQVEDVKEWKFINDYIGFLEKRYNCVRIENEKHATEIYCFWEIVVGDMHISCVDLHNISKNAFVGIIEPYLKLSTVFKNPSFNKQE